MEKSGGRKSLSLTTSSSGNLRHGVFQRFSGLKFERRLKVVLLSGAMGVLGPLAAYAGSSGLPLGANIEKTAPAGSVAAQTAADCLPWDVACLLLRPVGTVPVGPPFGGPDNQSDDGGGGGPGPGPGASGGGGGGGGGPGPGPGPGASDGDDVDGNNGLGNGHNNNATGQAGLDQGDPSNPAHGDGSNSPGNSGGHGGGDHGNHG